MPDPLLFTSPFSFDFGSTSGETPTGEPGVGMHPCFSDPTRMCDAGGDPVDDGGPLPDLAPWPSSTGSSGGAGGSGTLGTVLGTALTGLQDVLAYNLGRKQVEAGQYPSGVQSLFGQGGSVLPVSSGWLWIFVIVAIFLLLVRK